LPGVRVQSLGFRTDLGLRRLGGAQIIERDSHIVVRTPGDPGFWWGNFILWPAPLGPGEGSLLGSLFACEFPQADHVAVGIDGTDGTIGDATEVAALGVSAEVDAILSATRLREPSRPTAGAEFRALAGDRDWAQALRLRLATYLEDDTRERREHSARQIRTSRSVCERGAGAWFGALVDDQLQSALGVVRVEPGLVRYQAVETHPDHRGKGFASRLLYEASIYAIEVLGARTLVIAADPGYHAIGIYRSLGFEQVERQVQLERPPSAK
jgi:GNAT superfamily N-acetyltransferase